MNKIDLTDFLETHLPKKQLGYYSEEELKKNENNVSEDVIAFLMQEGKCTYNNDFFWTTLPDDYHTILSDWGWEGKKCFAFLRTSLGSIVFENNKEYYVLHPLVGKSHSLNNLFDLMLNNYFTAPIILEEGFEIQLHKKNRSKLPDLKEDEMYALNPPIPKGGSPKKSKIEVVKIKDHLHYLAELYDHRTTE